MGSTLPARSRALNDFSIAAALVLRPYLIHTCFDGLNRILLTRRTPRERKVLPNGHSFATSSTHRREQRPFPVRNLTTRARVSELLMKECDLHPCRLTIASTQTGT